MENFLDNPVYHALLTGDAKRGYGNDDVKYFDPEISPFVGFSDGYTKGFDDLHEMLPAERRILYASRRPIDEPKGWKLRAHIEGSQFVFTAKKSSGNKKGNFVLVPLEAKHADEMVALAALTKPGPFDTRTIEFGHYFGIFDKDKLVAMTGQRLHIYDHSEVSAVCTHPDHLGKGYGSHLLEHQVDLILTAGQKPFLHVRADNERAIFLYEQLGFKKNGPMNFYFLKRE